MLQKMSQKIKPRSRVARDGKTERTRRSDHNIIRPRTKVITLVNIYSILAGSNINQLAGSDIRVRVPVSGSNHPKDSQHILQIAFSSQIVGIEQGNGIHPEGYLKCGPRNRVGEKILQFHSLLFFVLRPDL